MLVPDILDAPVQAIHVDDARRPRSTASSSGAPERQDAVGDTPRSATGRALARDRRASQQRSSRRHPSGSPSRASPSGPGRTRCRSGSSTPSGAIPRPLERRGRRRRTAPAPDRRAARRDPRVGARSDSTASAAPGSARRVSETCSRRSGPEPAPPRCLLSSRHAAGVRCRHDPRRCGRSDAER